MRPTVTLPKGTAMRREATADAPSNSTTLVNAPPAAPPLAGLRTPARTSDRSVRTVEEVAPAVERVLAAHLAERRWDSDAVSERFTADVVSRLSELALRGGKRLRPAFLWCGWCAGGGTGEGERAVLRVGAALELLQVCALIHDDLMDCAPLRRGRPSLHVAFADLHRDRQLVGDAKEFGASAALLAGDLALVWAHDLWEATAVPTAARRPSRELWQAMRTEIVAGQYLDLHGPAAGTWQPAEALRIAHLKAGLYTVQRPLELGAALAGAPVTVRECLARAGQRVGVAFQLRDDLIDAYGDASSAGKPVGEDVRRGKPTYLMAVGLERAKAGEHRKAERVLTGALGDRALDDAGLERVRAALAEVGAPAMVRQRIDTLAREALDTVADADLPAAAAHELTGLITTLLGVPPSVGDASLRAPTGWGPIRGDIA
ncbi:polyprenyl synthetase family protein [Streptomyces zagrosensis]|uniref:Geranylgeranyl diphosphate synthase type I n=1 Tax=Streptomyces zagrosensis TaxID=1042984 RepID=A0A7W9V209_9ACTN|nr:polyprenyl synthetase family protein [Streptomyces zagrosensis]MBB5939765.1 geranylgeranyl diphosphate synthase type I [Streptomyces zagrosensis]